MAIFVYQMNVNKYIVYKYNIYYILPVYILDNAYRVHIGIVNHCSQNVINVLEVHLIINKAVYQYRLVLSVDQE